MVQSSSIETHTKNNRNGASEAQEQAILAAIQSAGATGMTTAEALKWSYDNVQHYPLITAESKIGSAAFNNGLKAARTRVTDTGMILQMGVRECTVSKTKSGKPRRTMWFIYIGKEDSFEAQLARQLKKDKKRILGTYNQYKKRVKVARDLGLVIDTEIQVVEVPITDILA